MLIDALYDGRYINGQMLTTRLYVANAFRIGEDTASIWACLPEQ